MRPLKHKKMQRDVQEIPAKWRTEVCAILDSAPDRIQVTLTTCEVWEAMFPDSDIGGIYYQMYACMSEALKVDGIKGIRIPAMGNDHGEIWEFLFKVDEKKNLYGKISLRVVTKNGTKGLYIYSSHLAERDYL